MKMTEIQSPKQWAAFEKELSERFKINCTVFDADGAGVTGKPNWCNRLCPVIKSNQESLAAICAVGNQNFMARARQTGNPVIGECDAGLIKICVPIISNGTFLGTAGGCGLLPAEGEVETYLLKKLLKQNEEEIADLCRGIGTMTQSQAEAMATYIETRLQELMH